jgi:hypothetical protein
MSGLDLSLTLDFQQAIEGAVELPASVVVDMAEACIAGVRAASGLMQFTPQATEILDHISAVGKGSGPIDARSREICTDCLRIYTQEELFGKLYRTVNADLRSIPRFIGRDPNSVLRALESKLGTLYPFVHVLLMGLKRAFSMGDEKKVIYRGTRINETTFAEFEDAALEGGCVLLTPFTSYSADVSEALRFPVDADVPEEGKVTVLFVLETCGRSPNGEFGAWDENEILLPPCQLYKVRRVTRFGEHGRPQVTLQGIALVSEEVSAFKSACQPQADVERLRVQYQLEGESKRFAWVLAEATVIEALRTIAEDAEVELESLWSDDVPLKEGPFADFYDPAATFLVKRKSQPARPCDAPKLAGAAKPFDATKAAVAAKPASTPTRE